MATDDLNAGNWYYSLDHASRAASWASTCCGESGARRVGSPGSGRDTFGLECRSGSNKQADIEKLRSRALLKEFEEYKTTKQRRLKVFRTEAVRAGFKAAWQDRDYTTIVKVAEKLPPKVLQEDATLLMYYDNALTRLGEE
jgi:hypothetical protein